MPKFKDEESRQKYYDRLRTRREVRIAICADICYEIAPTEGHTTWRQLTRDMLKYYHRNFEKVHKKYNHRYPDVDMHISASFMYNNRRYINLNMIDRYGWAIASKIELGMTKGVFKTDDPKVIEETLERHRRTINGSADSLNDYAEAVNQKMLTQIPYARVSQQLPASVN